MPEQSGEFAGRKVAIIGGGSELEQATARAFTDSGGQVARTQEDTGDGDGGVDRVVDRLGGLDVAIRFATTRSREPAISADPAVWRQDVDRVLTGAFIDAQTAARAMSRRGGGSIVLIGSVDATHAYPGRSAAAAAVSGLMGLTRALAVEFAPLGIRVNLVIPGPLLAEEARDMADREPQRLEQVRQRSPAHRLASPLEVTAAILFVAGMRAGFMTGQALPVDGGWTSLNQAAQLLAHP